MKESDECLRGWRTVARAILEASRVPLGILLQPNWRDTQWEIFHRCRRAKEFLRGGKAGDVRGKEIHEKAREVHRKS